MAEPVAIMLVDDEPALRLVAARILRRQGYEVLEASDASAAVTILNDRTIDAIVTDVTMAGVDGVTMATAMREQHPDLPIVFMSGDDRNAAKVDGFSGAFFLRKPFGSQALSEALAGVLAARLSDASPG